ncbi:MAG: dethiobiotin synthase [Kangiellaceae bacterium]|nr:dethiobiotin synthase [Kangiellaceae bacterium]
MKKFTNGLFITGTDTEVGKTFITQCVIRKLTKDGKRVAGLKPIASGAEWIEAQWQNEDALALQQASNVELSYQEINPFCFEPAIAPHIAAEQANQMLSVISLQEALAAPKADVTVIEGAGGWLTPLNQHETYADWVSLNQLPVILVVGMKLGCLNHAMLTVESIKSRGLSFVGWVANFSQKEMVVAEQNLEWLNANIQAPCLGVIPYQPSTNDLSGVEALLDLQVLL